MTAAFLSLVLSLLLHKSLPSPQGDLPLPKHAWSCPSQVRLNIVLIANLCLFSNIRKGRLLYIRPVGRSVGRLTSPLFFSIYTGIKALYQPSTTQYQSVSSYTDPVPPSYNQYRPILTHYHQIPTSIAL